jgi:hypothetical protein
MQEKEIREVDVLKGRLAEELIKLLFEESGYEVHRSGMEHILPLYTKRKPNEFDELELWIRRIPDFLIVKEGKSHFIEVKYVTKFYDSFYTRFEHYPDYPQVFVIVVTPTEIDCRTLNDIKNGIRFDNVYKRFLEEIKARKQETIEAGTFVEIDEEKLQTVFPEFQRSLNRLTILGIDENKRQRFHTYFLATAEAIINAAKTSKNV